jgi:hypothetical protein
VWGIGTALAGSPATQAADWSAAPSLTLGVDYDTNRILSLEPRGSGGVAGNFLVHLDRATEVLDLSLTPQVDFQYFTDPTLQSANDYGVTGGLSWAGERSSVTMNAVWNNQSLLTAEKFDTGIIDFGTRRLLTQLGGSWSLETTERTVSSFSGSYQGTDFTGTPVATLQNSTYSTLGFNEGFVRSSQLEFDLGGSVGDFSSPSEGGTSRSYSADVGFKRQWTERLKITGDVGANEISYGAVASRGFIFALNLSYATTVGSVSLAAQRNASPSGFGVLSERDAVQFSASRALSDRLNFGAAFDLYRNSSAVGAITFDARTYVDASVSLSWRCTETLTFTAHVLGDGARTQGTPGDVHGANVGFQALWSPNAHSISR